MPSFTRESGGTQHVAVMGVNRIGKEGSLGPDHPELATSLSNAADSLQSLGRYDEAEPLYLRALAILEVELVPDDPGIAVVLSNLGEFYRTLGRYGEAEPLHLRALAIREKVLAPGIEIDSIIQ